MNCPVCTRRMLLYAIGTATTWDESVWAWMPTAVQMFLCPECVGTVSLPWHGAMDANAPNLGTLVQCADCQNCATFQTVEQMQALDWIALDGFGARRRRPSQALGLDTYLCPTCADARLSRQPIEPTIPMEVRT